MTQTKFTQYTLRWTQPYPELKAMLDQLRGKHDVPLESCKEANELIERIKKL